MKPCPLRLDTPPAMLADALLEAGWTLADLEAWYLALVLAFLEGGGWHTVPEGLAVEQWELLLPGEPHRAVPAE